MKTTRVLYAAALLVAACETGNAQRETTTSASRAAADGAIAGKPQAPVRIEADVGASSATVRLQFDRAGTNVEVRANGVDGLTLLSDPVLAQGRTVAAGETATFDVPFRAGPGQSLLAVHVRGAFGAGERTAVRAFLVGKPSAEQMRKAQQGTTKIGGDDVRLGPAEEKK
jgi:hypothetical protein